MLAYFELHSLKDVADTVFNRPGVAEAVVQTPLLLIN